MKKIITILFVVLITGMFSAFTTSDFQECKTKCCKTETCKQHCIDSKCCVEGKTCDITNGKECKHKCCDNKSNSCEITDAKSCCKK